MQDRSSVMDEFKKVLNDWMPKGVEASREIQSLFEEDSEFSLAVKNGTTMLVNEYVQAVNLGDPLHGRIFSLTLTQPMEFTTNFYIMILISNTNADDPKSRLLLMTPEEIKDNATIWPLLDGRAQKMIDAMLDRNRSTPS